VHALVSVETFREVDMRTGLHRFVRGGGARAALALMLGAPKKW
jgi:hypothetical protein